ncbi:MAG: oligosaccharide flippase family protein [Sulfuritalea sp.]|nr:oligosaccharide flippase family protein [Sulfuritalea sp.]
MKSLVTYSFLYAGTAGLQKALGFVLYIWLAYSVTVTDYATFGLLLALQSGVATLAGAGIADSVVGLFRHNNSKQLRTTLFSIANGSFLYLSTVAGIMAILIFALPIWDKPVAITVKLAVLIGGVLTAFFTLQAALVRLEERHLASVALLFIAPVTGLCIAFFAVYIWRDVGAFFSGFAVGSLLAYLAFSVARVGHFSFEVRPADVEPIRKTIGPYIFIAFLAWIAGYGNTYIVKFLFSENDVARFTFVYTLSSIMHLVATSTNQVWGPRFIRLVSTLNRADIEEKNMRFYTIQGLTLGLIGSVVLLLLPAALNVIGGNLSYYQDINIEVLILFCGYAVSIPWWHSQNYYIVLGFGGILKNHVLSSTAIGLGVGLVLMKLLGPIGIYVGFLAQAIIRSMTTFIWARKQWHLRLAWQGPLIAICLFVAGGLCGPPLLTLVKGQ